MLRSFAHRRVCRGLRFSVRQVTPTIQVAFYSHNAIHFLLPRLLYGGVCEVICCREIRS